MLLYQISTSAIHQEKIKKSYENNKFKISTAMWHEKFMLPD